MYKLIALLGLLMLCFTGYKCLLPKNTKAKISTNKIIVDFTDDTSEEHIKKLGKKLHINFSQVSNYTNTDKVYIGDYYGENENVAIDELRHNKNVEAADEEMVYSIPEKGMDYIANTGIKTTNKNSSFPNDALYKDQWHMKQIHLPNNWNDKKRNGNGVIVAVIDTGVSRLSDFNETNMTGGYNFVSDNSNANDDNGHGTHVAGTIAESTNNGIGGVGVAWRSTIMPVKVLSAEGSGSVSGIVQGIHWAVDHGADVINMSLGGGRYNDTMANAVKYAYDKGVVVVCAAGNNGQGKVIYPAAYPGAIAVAATQIDERTTFYSNWGKEIAISAPGGNTRGDGKGGVLQNTINEEGKEGYYYLMGTSMASPHIAGVVSMIISEGVVRNPDLVRKILIETARLPNGMTGEEDGYSYHYGAGIVDADRAIARAKSLNKNKFSNILYLLICFGAIVILLKIRKKHKKNKGK